MQSPSDSVRPPAALLHPASFFPAIPRIVLAAVGAVLVARAAMLLAVPMIGPTSGMALTELPAMAMASLSVLAVVEAVAAAAPRRAWLWWTLSGAAAGFAIRGRQTFLPALLGFALIGFATLAAYYWNAPPTDPRFKMSAPPEIVAQMPLGDVEKGIR